jgi:predicted component of type VI protein secretion system
MPYLIVMDGAQKGRRFDLSKGTFRIGRVAGNDFVIENPSVSSGHAELVVDGNNYTVRDRNSTNGTRVNGRRITSSPIFRNDVLMFGDLLISFTGDDAPLRPENPPATVYASPSTAPAAPTSPSILASASASATVVIPHLSEEVPPSTPTASAAAKPAVPVVAEKKADPPVPVPVPVQAPISELPSPTRQMVTISSVITGVRPAICPPDFRKRHDTRLVWVTVIVLLLGLIAYAAHKFIQIIH